MASDGPFPLPWALALPITSHRIAITHSPCWAPHFKIPPPCELKMDFSCRMGDFAAKEL